VDVTQQRELNARLNQSHGSFELVVSPLILALLGFLLDTRVTHTTPVFTIVAAVFGVVGATTKLLLEYKAKMAELDAAGPWSQRKGAGA
jgi:F0F1-type ATP synthase assembly protein I